ncbi:MAG TPA: CBS domain-containing protein [Thermoanaerobaculia bacterium]|nr:CBS domain-containing protein [Thermoanaerobaculia bacterium]
MISTRLQVRDLMTSGVFAVGVEDDLETVTNLMDDRNIRHAPVVDGAGNLVGLVTQRDILRTGLGSPGQLPPEAERQARLHLRAGEIMNADVVTARPDQDIREAARIMLDNKFGCLPVVEGRMLVGIVTESDFVRLMAAGD